MTSRVNLVVILLTLGCFVSTLVESKFMQPEERRYFLDKIIPKVERNKTVLVNAHSSENAEVVRQNVKEEDTGNNIEPFQGKDADTGEESRGKKKQMDQTLIALLIAYKMKFIALIPTMLGGLMLLKATALLAGFFFALFAAVLGLKVH